MLLFKRGKLAGREMIIAFSLAGISLLYGVIISSLYGKFWPLLAGVIIAIIIVMVYRHFYIVD